MGRGHGAKDLEGFRKKGRINSIITQGGTDGQFQEAAIGLGGQLPRVVSVGPDHEGLSGSVPEGNERSL